MITFRSSHRVLFRYDRLQISRLILGGSVRVSTLEACRKAENPAARDAAEGTITVTSLPGTNSLNASELSVSVLPALSHLDGAHHMPTLKRQQIDCRCLAHRDVIGVSRE